MLLFENIKQAFTAILANKMRALLTMLGIIIGIGSVIAIETVGNSLTSSFTSSMESMGANNVTVRLQQKSTSEETDERGMSFRGPQFQRTASKDDLMTDEMCDALIEEFPDSIKGISKTCSVGTGTITRFSNTATVSVEGGNDTYFTQQDLTILYGDDFGDKALDGGKGVCIMSDNAAEKLYKDAESALGQSVEVVSNGKFYEYVVAGIYEYSSDEIMGMADEDPTTTLYIPLKKAQESTHTYGYSSFTVLSASGVDVDTLMDDIESFFDRYYHNNKNFAPATSSMSSMVSTMTEMLGTIQIAISIIAGISLLVGGIGVMNIMLVSISERTREIGIRKALGATNGSIRVQFIVESMILCLLGGVIGIIIGVGGGSFAASKMGYEAAPSITSIVLSVGFSLLIGVFFGYYPANKAAQMNPIDALSYE